MQARPSFPVSSSFSPHLIGLLGVCAALVACGTDEPSSPPSTAAAASTPTAPLGFYPATCSDWPTLYELLTTSCLIDSWNLGRERGRALGEKVTR